MSQTDGKLTPGDYRQITAWLVGSMAVAAACATLTANIVAGSDARVIVALWLSGAASLGLLSGYTTGASKEAGAASEFLKYLSGGVLIPLLGGGSWIGPEFRNDYQVLLGGSAGGISSDSRGGRFSDFLWAFRCGWYRNWNLFSR